MTDLSGRPVAILVIEDDPGDFGLIRVHLRSAGLGHGGDKAPLAWEKTLAAGLALGRTQRPDVVLLDLSLPDSKGIATVEKLRAALRGVPIVVLTGHDDNELAVRAVQAGAQDYLVKGQFAHDALGRAVRYAMVREKLEQDLARSNRLYAALSQCNQAIVRCSDELELFPTVCRVAVELGGMKMAWIGYTDQATQRILPVASFGEGAEYLQDIDISADANSPFGQGPTGTAVREARPYWCQDFLNNPTTAPWHERGRHFGWGASASLPLIRSGSVVGTFTLYAGEANVFDEAARELLLEMSTDIGFALTNFAREAERLKAQERILWLSQFDALTGLVNHALLNDRFNHALSMARRSGKPMTLMSLDLDHFKNINDTLGRHIGDSLLVEIARRIQSVVHSEDTVSRQGGDEFILLLPTSDPSGAAHMAEKLLQVIAATHQVETHELVVTPSIGIAVYPGDGDDFESLSKNADVAMYRAKQGGRNGYRFFATEMQTSLARTLQLEGALRHALERDQLRLHYQPQLSLRDGRIVGAEALLRWQHPEFGMVSPAEFIPIAEASGLILQIGEWVLATAARQMRAWLQMNIAPGVVAVNLSAAQFRHPKLTERVIQILHEQGLPPEHLELELTESAAMDDPPGAIAVMDALHAHGIRMSIDDFGTGYSSLNYLKRFKLCKLKIDQSFVRNLHDNAEDKAIVNSIIGLARSLGLQTIAEGVETEDQLAFLRANGCGEVQGYYCSRPLPVEAAEAFLRRQAREEEEAE
ncbi:MAG: EAL domain-containing protein [Proteobacteria bacterium]|nr:EAL domain-containing protein [Pseudomonadota bacterium]